MMRTVPTGAMMDGEACAAWFPTSLVRRDGTSGGVRLDKDGLWWEEAAREGVEGEQRECGMREIQQLTSSVECR